MEYCYKGDDLGYLTMKAKFVNEDIKNIFKPKIGDVNVLLKDLSDIKKNNKRINYFFKGDVNEVLNLSEHLTDFYNLKIREIEEKYLELYQSSKFLNNTSMIKFLDDFFDKTYYHSISRERRFYGNHFDWIKKRQKYCWIREDAAKFLNTNFYDIVKEYLDSLNVKMTDPEISNSGYIICRLDKMITEEETDELNDLLKQHTNYRIYQNKDGNDNIFPVKK